MQTLTELEERFKRLTNLPTLPEIASRLMTMVNDPLVSTSDVAAIIAQDPSLSSRVLRLSNSAFYGMPGKINTINHAVVLLGFKIITTIVLSLTVFDMFPENKRSRRLFDRKAFWLHSLCCGLVARRLAQHAKKRFLFDPEELFCAGLLHDIGKIVLEQYLHEEFHTALAVAKDRKIPQHRAEIECLGFSHANVAELLTAGWGLPAQISKALAMHHEPGPANQLIDSAGVCHVADWLCYSLGIVIDLAYQAPDCDASIIEGLGCTPELFEEIRNKTQQELETSSLFLPA